MKSNEYIDFLREIVEMNSDDPMEHQLFETLFGIDFFSLIPNDDNRGMDGIELRDLYAEKGGQHALSFGPCTVLEMLIGLSFRLVWETTGSKWEKTPRQWFWILIDNLGLDYRHQQGLSGQAFSDEILESVTLLLERRYKGDGNGGLFPLKHPQKDQKRVEIWYQMTSFVMENYPI